MPLKRFQLYLARAPKDTSAEVGLAVGMVLSR